MAFQKNRNTSTLSHPGLQSFKLVALRLRANRLPVAPTVAMGKDHLGAWSAQQVDHDVGRHAAVHVAMDDSAQVPEDAEHRSLLQPISPERASPTSGEPAKPGMLWTTGDRGRRQGLLAVRDAMRPPAGHGLHGRFVQPALRSPARLLAAIRWAATAGAVPRTTGQARSVTVLCSAARLSATGCSPTR